MRPSLAVFALVVFTISIFADPSRADWVQNGTAMCDVEMDQTNPVAIADGTGGAIVVWKDYRNYLDWDIYAQRIDSYGNPVWALNGVPVCTAANDQGTHVIAPDGSGGVVVTWLDYRNGTDYDVYAQRIDQTGAPVWTTNGVAACSAANNQAEARIIGDGTGGAYVVWEDYRDGVSLDIYFQRVMSDGSLQHGSTGAVACTTSFNQSVPVLADDAAGGAIVVWQDFRDGLTWDLYGIRFGPAGNTLWAPNGWVLCSAADDQTSPQIAPDGLGGVFMVWKDDRGVDRDIYAQRVSNDGYERWAANGIPICTASWAQDFFDIAVEQNEHCLFVTWRDPRNFPDDDIYIQKVDLWGDTLWTAGGAVVCSAPQDQQACSIVPDHEGGAIVCWEDYRYLAEADIFAQRVDAGGAPLWTIDGDPVSVFYYHQFEPVIVDDGEHGAFVFWYDYRNTSHYDVFAQRMTSGGLWGYPCPFIHSIRDVPGDQGGQVNVTWDASRLDVPPGGIESYTLWRAIDAKAAAEKIATGAAVVTGAETEPGRLVEGMLRADNPYYWELVATVQAFQLDRYAKPVATLFDSTSVTDELHYFQVIAHGTGGGMWISPAGAGRSVDNLSPAAPLSLAAARVLQEVELEWNPGNAFEGDFSHYAVYRSEAAGFTPGPGNFLTTTPDTVLTDTSAELFRRYYYVVTAWDIHENQSAPSNEAMVDVATGVGGRAPSFERLTLLPNTPNPFGVSTEIRFGLPAPADVVLEVYDIAGRRLLAKSLGKTPAGLRTWTFDGRNSDGAPMPSGVYFCRISAAGTTVTQKLVIAR